MAVTRTWEATVGSEIARNAWPARMKRDGTLLVHVRTSVWAFELTQMSEEIRSRLDPPPEKIRFVVGRVPEPAGLPPGSAPRPAPRPDERALEQAASLGTKVTSETLREALEKAASLGLTRQRSDRPL